MNSKRILAVSTGLVLLFVVLAPVVSATHLTSMYTRTPLGPLDPGAGYVFEDDEQVAHAPGTNLHGLANRVTKNATDPIGEGDMLFDSKFLMGANPGIGGAYYTHTATVGHTILPGMGYFIGFLGWWDDKNTDGVIDLFRDEDDVEEDEFKWRGAATGENLNMVLFTVPRFASMGFLGSDVTRTSPGAWANPTAQNATAAYADRTALTEDQQKWVVGNGWQSVFLDEGLIMTFQTISVADAEAASGGQIVNVLNQTALIDVDRYESLNAEAEGVYYSTARDVLATINFAFGTVNPIVNPIIDPILDPLFDDVDELLSDQDATRASVIEVVSPRFLKEPNTDEDDFEGRAGFGGAGDFWGTGNDYTSYQDDFGFWFDAFGEMHVGTAGNVEGPPGSPQTPGVYGYDNFGFEPFASSDPENERNAGVLFSIGATVLAWHDVNKDNWIGVICDPDEPEEWDAEHGRCAKDPHYTSWADDVGWQPNGPRFGRSNGWGDEVVGVCAASHHKNTPIMVEPIGGDWPVGTVVMRNYDRPTKQIWEQTWEVPTGDEPVFLNWDLQCQAGAHYTRALDQIFFPRGNIGVTLRTTAEAYLPVFQDAVKGIDITAQSVLDIDYYPASM